MNQSTNGPVEREVREGWPHPDFHDNYVKFPWEQLEPFRGRYVAFNWEGTRIVADAGDDEELLRKVTDLGIPIDKVVFDYIDAD